MRLLQLNPNGNEASALDFHPMVTVVTSLSAAGRDRVINAITSLPRGSDPGCHGLLEAHGVLLDLTPQTLRMLDLSLDLDVLIQARDLPGAAAVTGITVGGKPLDSPASALPRSVTPLSVEDFLAVTPEGTYPDLDKARFGQNQAREALAVLKEAAVRARAAHEEAKVRTRVAELTLERAVAEAAPRANLRLVTDEFDPADLSGSTEAEGGASGEDAFSLDDIFTGAADAGSVTSGTAREALADATAASAASIVSLHDQRDELETRERELQAQIAKIDRGIAELAGLDARPIQVLVDAINNPAPVELVPSQRGVELADEFVRLQTEVSRLEGSLEDRGLGSRSAMERLDHARREVAAAEKGVRPPEFTEADRTELEAAHDEVLDAANGRGRGGKKRLDDAIVKEQMILDRIGFPTWSAYVMGAGLMSIDPAAEQKLEKARFELESAEAHWSDVAAMIEADPVHRELLDKLEALYLEAFDLLGGDDGQDDLEVKLRNLQVAKREVSIDELVEALAYQLELVGMKLPAGSPTLDRTVLVAEAFLEEASAIIDRLNELGGEKVEALTDLQHVEQRLGNLPSQEEAARLAQQTNVDAESDADLAAAQADDDERAAVARAALSAEEAAALAETEREELEQALAVAIELESESVDLVDAREALLDAAIQVESVATSRLNRLAGDLATTHAAEVAAEPAPEPTSVQTDAAFADADDVDAGPEALEFYLLARLAALRSASFAGSVPLVIDDALAELPKPEIERLLHKLERMSESVQIVYLSDDPTVRTWAQDIGFERAAVVAAPPSFV